MKWLDAGRSYLEQWAKDTEMLLESQAWYDPKG
jgi:hypothetical protein